MAIEFKVGDKFNIKPAKYWYVACDGLVNPVYDYHKEYWPAIITDISEPSSYRCCTLKHANGYESCGFEDDIFCRLIQIIEPDKIFISKSRFELITDL